MPIAKREPSLLCLGDRGPGRNLKLLRKQEIKMAGKYVRRCDMTVFV